MEIRQLMYLTQIAKEKSYTVAAQKLHVSQPALSKMIKNLEIELGVPIFIHSRRNPELTDIGKSIVEESCKILESVENLSKSIEDTINLKKGNVAVGIPPVISTVYFPKVISGFQSMFPDIKLNVVEAGAEEVQEKILNGLIDIGFVIMPVDEKRVDVYPVTHDLSVLLVNKDHPLACRQKINTKDLKNERFILLDDSYMLHHHILYACRKAGFEANVDFQTSQWDLIVRMVSYNQGISILPRPILKEFKASIPSIKEVIIDDPIFKWKVIMILKKGHYVTYAMRAFIRFVEKEFYNKR
ncbi:LysR family transcriptional regulator [Sporolactobacillus sp. CQH2019]|uniref:LysR family transcriptional regulator n=1 Tax=Sporolactobacillus sp. CQH2019 TaxID=3023512 RepID=UPI00236848C8|nr:LysR family transcriptional regulator [Sporolactobacillus sp. CQH2019]MDD9149779.1 LysR family transcriptional regulator [Sporolactobacillus sp. CQH2019]